jgi:hypothetical protein
VTGIRAWSIGSIGVVAWMMTGCSPSQSASAPPPAAQKLWGDLKPIVSVKELMHNMIDPLADNIFDAVAVYITKEGVREVAPKTDEDWDRVRVGAVTMVEGVYLLKIPRPFAPPGDNNNSEGPEAAELSPVEITAKVEKDPVLWNAKIEALRNAGLEVLEIVKKRDANALWQAAEDIDAACENCHLEYWYPNQTQLMSRLNKRLDELYGKATASSARLGMEPPAPKR